MRLVLLLLLGLASIGNSANVKSTVIGIYWDDRVCSSKTDDGSNYGYDLTETGTVPYGTGSLPPAGSSAAGVFSTSNYMRQVNGGLAAALTNSANSYSFSMNVSYTSRLSQHVILSAGVNQFFSLAITTGVMRWYDSALIDESTTAVGLNGWHNLGFTWDGTNRRYYLDGTLDRTNVTSAIWDATGVIHFGIYAAVSVPFDGLINSIIVTNTVETVFPIAPFVASTSLDKRGLSLDSFIETDLDPNGNL